MIRAIAIGIPIGITFVDCVGYIAKVEGISMQPSLNPENSDKKDFVFLNRWHSKSFCYNKGEVVSVVSPKNPSERLIKRIIALEGDLVQTKGYKKKYFRVPSGHCWIEGDHTGHSYDSNSFGPVAIGLITAKASYIVWPPMRWGKLVTKIPVEHSPKSSKFSDMEELLFEED